MISMFGDTYLHPVYEFEGFDLLSEEELVRLLIQERSMILGYVQSIVGSIQMAEDVYQDVAVIALKKHREIEDLRNPSAWFRKIARLQTMNLIRKKKPLHIPPEAIDLLDHVWDAYDAYDSEKMDGLRFCLEKLPSKMKEIVTMRYHQEQKASEIAAKTGLTKETVYVYVSKAHRMLKECVDRFVSKDIFNVEES